MKNLIPLLDVQNLSKSFDNNQIFSDLSFSLSDQDRLGLLGPNGSGKSTLAKILIQFELYDSGKIYLHGENQTNFNKRVWSKHIQYIGQYTRNTLDPTKKIKSCLKEPVKNFQITSPEEQEKMIASYLSKLNLEVSILEKYPLELSGGQYQRVCIALTLLVNPEIIICDEMTASLDKISEISILNFFRHELKQTLIVISHNPFIIQYLCNKTLNLADFKRK